MPRPFSHCTYRLFTLYQTGCTTFQNIRVRAGISQAQTLEWYFDARRKGGRSCGGLVARSGGLACRVRVLVGAARGNKRIDEVSERQGDCDAWWEVGGGS